VFKFIGATVVYGFALFGLSKFLERIAEQSNSGAVSSAPVGAPIHLRSVK
jgi:hypothetical protein